MESKKELKKMKNERLYKEYFEINNRVINNVNPKDLSSLSPRAQSYYVEIQRRENEKANKTMRRWTIAIGIMTAAMLVATVVNALIVLKVIR